MKLREIKWKSHPILGNLKLNFLNGNKEPCDTIILAGENGTGKTTILETIHSFLNMGPITPFEYIEYQINSNIYTAYPIEDNFHNNYFIIQNIETQQERKIQTDRYNNFNRIKEDTEDPRHYGCLYSKAQANYPTQPIQVIGRNSLDNDIYTEEKEIKADALKQLLIDIQTLDNNDANRTRPQTQEEWTHFDSQSRIYRFSSTFNAFFSGVLTYDRIEFDNENNNYQIYFKKNGIDIKIDNLSTGESQIVFRGTYLLRNVGKLNGCIVFIDEPEISMHPLWQQKILSYYKGLFIHNNQQIAQLIIATHSQGIVSEALKDSVNTKVIKLMYNADGSIQNADISIPPVLKNIQSVEVNYQVFGVASTDYHNALYGYIENKGWMSDYKRKKGESEDYIKQKKDGTPESPVKKCLSEKIRHIIHHPENKYNSYTSDELKKSIEDMRKYISSKQAVQKHS